MTDYFLLDMITNVMFLISAVVLIIGVVLLSFMEEIVKKGMEKKRKKELLALTVHRSPSVSDLERVAEDYSAPCPPEDIFYMEGACRSLLDANIRKITVVMEELYELLDDKKNTKEQTEGIDLSIMESRALLAFLTFMQTHGVGAFFADMQSDAFPFLGKGEDDD